MWWNILPSIVIISVSVGLPHLIAPISNWFLVGNFFRRSLLDRDLRAQYLRDYRLTGNPYILSNLDQIPDKSEDEDDRTEEEKELDRCKILVEEKALQEALDRPVKCPKVTEMEMTEEEEALEKCERRKVAKKKKKAKRDENIVVDPVNKQDTCKKELSLCDLSDPKGPPPSGEGTVAVDETVPAVDETVAAVDEVAEASKKCKKGGGDEVDGVAVDGVKKCRDKKARAVVVSDTPQKGPAEEKVVVTSPEERQESQDTSGVVAGEGPKKCKKANGVGVDDTSRKCKKKKLMIADSSGVQANEDETQQSQDTAGVVASEGPKKCKKKKLMVADSSGIQGKEDEEEQSQDTASVVASGGLKKCKKITGAGGEDTSRKCKKKSAAAASSAGQVNEDEDKQVIVVVDEGRKNSKCRKGDGLSGEGDEGTRKRRSKESAEK